MAGLADEPMILRHADGRRPRILVAEDVATNRIVAKGLLGKLGCDVDLVEDGEQAVAAVKNGEYDLVLMDVSMPEMDGPTAARLIRELPAPMGEIPIVALTAYSRPEELAPMLNAGAVGMVNKPIVLEDLFRTLHGICCGQPEVV
jgi:CheY-like chemotaxis protein